MKATILGAGNHPCQKKLPSTQFRHDQDIKLSANIANNLYTVS